MNAIVGTLRRYGVNRPVVFSLFARGAQAVAALATVVLVARYLSPESQGFYYTFLSFVAFVQLAEFGMSYAVMQSASHEAVIDPRSVHSAESLAVHARRRLRSLLRGAARFAAVTTVLAGIVVALVGTVVLRAGATPDTLGWHGPWALTVLAACAGQLLVPRITLLEGAGEVTAVWQFRLRQEIVTAIALWLALIAGLELWSVGLAYVVRALYGIAWLSSGMPVRFFEHLRVGAEPVIPDYWRREVWPFQWRIGLSILAGYFIFQLFAPVMFASRGARVAGQFGMTVAIANGLLAVTTGWLNSQAPLYGRLIALGEYRRLDEEFARAVRSSLAVVVGVALAAVASVTLLSVQGHPLSERVLPPVPFALFMTTAVANHVTFSLAVYLRAHRREPLVVLSVVGAVATSVIIYETARLGSVTAAAAWYLAVTLIGGVATLIIFGSRRRAWHTPGKSCA